MKPSGSPRVSVVTATFNMGSFISEALESALGQSYPLHELIVVDDGSTDDTLDRLERLKDPRLQVVRGNHGGASRARNLGLERVSGDIVTFLDADDRWVPTKLEREVELFAAEPAVGAIFLNFLRFSADQGFFPLDQFAFYPELREVRSRPAASGPGRVVEGEAFSSLVTFQELPGWLPAATFRKGVVEGLRFDPALPPCEDLHYCFRAYRRSAVAFISEPLVHMRRHPANASRDLNAMPRAAFRAMLALENEPLTPMQRDALDRRLARSLVDFGRQDALRGDLAGALTQYRAALKRHGRPLSVAKQLALTPYYLLRGRGARGRADIT